MPAEEVDKLIKDTTHGRNYGDDYEFKQLIKADQRMQIITKGA